MPKPATEHRLREATRALVVAHGTLDNAERPCGTPLPIPHAWSLLELAAHGPMSVTELASRLHIDRTNVSRLCARMQELGEITRTPHPEDKRAKLVSLTEHGRNVAASVDASSAAHFRALCARLESPESIIAALEALTAAMRISDQPPAPDQP